MNKQIFGNIHSEPTQKVGFVVKTQGYKGAIKLNLETEEIESLLSEQEFLLLIKEGKWVPYLIEEFNPNNLVVKLADINSEEDAQKLIGHDVCLHNSILESIENSVFSFNGFVVLNQNKEKIGIVKDFIEMPGHSLLEVASENKDYLVPFHEDLIIEINEEKEYIILEIAEGLFDI